MPFFVVCVFFLFDEPSFFFIDIPPKSCECVLNVSVCAYMLFIKFDKLWFAARFIENISRRGRLAASVFFFLFRLTCFLPFISIHIPARQLSCLRRYFVEYFDE